MNSRAMGCGIPLLSRLAIADFTSAFAWMVCDMEESKYKLPFPAVTDVVDINHQIRVPVLRPTSPAKNAYYIWVVRPP